MTHTVYYTFAIASKFPFLLSFNCLTPLKQTLQGIFSLFFIWIAFPFSTCADSWHQLSKYEWSCPDGDSQIHDCSQWRRFIHLLWADKMRSRVMSVKCCLWLDAVRVWLLTIIDGPKNISSFHNDAIFELFRMEMEIIKMYSFSIIGISQVEKKCRCNKEIWVFYFSISQSIPSFEKMQSKNSSWITSTSQLKMKDGGQEWRTATAIIIWSTWRHSSHRRCEKNTWSRIRAYSTSIYCKTHAAAIGQHKQCIV